jgi:hypothetical protein
MPVINGEKMIEAVRRNSSWAALPVVVISSEASQARIDHVKSMGAKFLRKPSQALSAADDR